MRRPGAALVLLLLTVLLASCGGNSESSENPGPLSPGPAIGGVRAAVELETDLAHGMDPECPANF